MRLLISVLVLTACLAGCSNAPLTSPPPVASIPADSAAQVEAQRAWEQQVAKDEAWRRRWVAKHSRKKKPKKQVAFKVPKGERIKSDPEADPMHGDVVEEPTPALVRDPPPAEPVYTYQDPTAISPGTGSGGYSSRGSSASEGSSRQCQGITRKGVQCRRMVRGGSYCYQHGG